MILCQDFILKHWDWHVKVFYVVDLIPIDYIIEELYELGCNERDVQSAIDVLDNGDDNRGITFSNDKQRASIIVIGETSCPAQFSNSFDHEKLHLVMHIARVNDIDPFGEELAYLAGEIGFQTFPIAKRFLCEHCREDLK